MIPKRNHRQVAAAEGQVDKNTPAVRQRNAGDENLNHLQEAATPPLQSQSLPRMGSDSSILLPYTRSHLPSHLFSWLTSSHFCSVRLEVIPVCCRTERLPIGRTFNSWLLRHFLAKLRVPLWSSWGMS